MIKLIQIENTGEGKIRFATKEPTVVEVLLVDGKMFVHSEPLPIKTAVSPATNAPQTASFSGNSTKTKSEEKELDFLKETKSS